MGKDPKNPTIILTHESQPLPKLQLLFINLKWDQSTFKTHATTSMLRTISMMTLTLFMCVNNTTEKMLRMRNIFNM